MWFNRKPKPVKTFLVPEYIVFNVDNFNKWFNAPDNNAIYANPGIYLRIDKLSEDCITDYILKCYGLSGGFLWSKPTHTMLRDFHTAIVHDWKVKLIGYR